MNRLRQMGARPAVVARANRWPLTRADVFCVEPMLDDGYARVASQGFEVQERPCDECGVVYFLGRTESGEVEVGSAELCPPCHEEDTSDGTRSRGRFSSPEAAIAQRLAGFRRAIEKLERPAARVRALSAPLEKVGMPRGLRAVLETSRKLSRMSVDVPAVQAIHEIAEPHRVRMDSARHVLAALDIPLVDAIRDLTTAIQPSMEAVRGLSAVVDAPTLQAIRDLFEAVRPAMEAVRDLPAAVPGLQAALELSEAARPVTETIRELSTVVHESPLAQAAREMVATLQPHMNEIRGLSAAHAPALRTMRELASVHDLPALKTLRQLKQTFELPPALKAARSLGAASRMRGTPQRDE